MKKDKQMSLLADLALAPIAGILGCALGNMASWVNPFAVPNEIKEIRNGSIKNVTDFSYAISSAVGYGAGWYNTVSQILENPNKADNYLPLITNGFVLAIGGILATYNKGKKDGSLEVKLAEENSQ